MEFEHYIIDVPSAAQVEQHSEFTLGNQISQYIPFYVTDWFGIVTAETILNNTMYCNISKNYLWHRMGYIVIFNHVAGIPIECPATCAVDST